MQTHELDKGGKRIECKENTRKKYNKLTKGGEEEVESFNVKKSRAVPIDRRELSNLFNSRIKR